MDIFVIPEAWGCARSQDVSAVLNSVKHVFLPCFGEAMLHLRSVRVVRIPDGQTPVCYRQFDTILLTAVDTFWSQYAYQFAHEFCHFQIPEEVPSQLRWFEEAICELASYYFMPKLSALWEVYPPYPNWKSYAPCFTEYANKNAQKMTSFDVDFSNSENPSIQYLENEPYDRQKNAFVATLMMPIFQKTPTLWSTVPLLCQIPTGLSFLKSLKYWKELSPSEYQNAISEIAGIFSLKL